MDVMPDLIGVYFNVETDGSTSKISEDENSAITDALMEKLSQQGFEEEEIQTTSYNIYPNYNWNSGKNRITGYRASHTLRIEISSEDSEKLGTIIDAATDSRAGISYINFELSKDKENEYKSEALKLAAQDAKLKAKSIADGLDKRLGRLVSTSDNSFYYSPWRVYESAASGGISSNDEAKMESASIQPGEQTITGRISATYRIY
jgi:hypothetical protein